ncbi:NifU family protein [Pacificimonas flava]|uniref:NifU family protein n=2 Tax=Pacificimonas TaxID=1960290 RepID=A0A219B1C2_9SPHN|nr:MULTISPECIES: NifU family protein [Pacificimonas]MBZ6378254.1 NifU family protein [Pacificimonas aurantium]OWV32125.1 NifU family protein [Pacificimonas flava]
MHIQTQPTPNPATLMFQPGRPVSPERTYDFDNPDDAEVSPLASALFSLGSVTGVFFGADFVSVTRDPAGSDWATLKPEVMGILVDHFASGAPLVRGETETAPRIDENEEDADIRAQITELLDDRVRPAVAGDGGDIVFHGFQEGIVYLKMQGACAGCPSSTMTLKNGIENLLRYYVPEVTEVRAV